MPKGKPDPHADLVQAAKDAADAVYSDTTVDKHRTLESMEDIAEHIESGIDALKDEIRREESL